MNKLVPLVVLEGLVLVALALLVCSPGAAAGAGAPGSALAAAGSERVADLHGTRTTAAVATDPASRASRAELRSAVPVVWSPDDPIGVLVHGTVTTPDGTLLREASLAFALDDERLPATTGTTGHYALAGLRPGNVRVQVGAAGHVPVQRTLTLSDAARQTFDFVLEPTYSVRVFLVTATGEDANVALARQLGTSLALHVVAVRESLPERLATTERSALMLGDARWNRAEEGKDGCAGTLELMRPPPTWVAVLFRSACVTQQLVGMGQREVRFVVDPAAVMRRRGPCVRACSPRKTAHRSPGWPASSGWGTATSHPRLRMRLGRSRSPAFRRVSCASRSGCRSAKRSRRMCCSGSARPSISVTCASRMRRRCVGG